MKLYNKNGMDIIARLLGAGGQSGGNQTGGLFGPSVWDEKPYGGTSGRVSMVKDTLWNLFGLEKPDSSAGELPDWLKKAHADYEAGLPTDVQPKVVAPMSAPPVAPKIRPDGWRPSNFRELGKALVEGWKSPEMVAHEKMQNASSESSPEQPQATPRNQTPVSLPDASDWKFGDVSPFRRLVQRLAKELNDSENRAKGNPNGENSQFEKFAPSEPHLPLLASDISTTTDFGETFAPVYSDPADNVGPAHGDEPGHSRPTVEFPAPPPTTKGKSQQQGQGTSKPVNQELGTPGSKSKKKSQEIPPKQQVGGKPANSANSTNAQPSPSSSAKVGKATQTAENNPEAQGSQTIDKKKECGNGSALTYDEFLGSLNGKQREKITEGGEFHYNVLFKESADFMKTQSPDAPVTVDMASVGKWIDENKSVQRKLYEKGLALAGVDISNPFAKMKSMTMEYNDKNNSVEYCFDTGSGSVEQVFPDKIKKLIFEQGASFEKQISSASGSSYELKNVKGVKYYDGNNTYDVTDLDMVNKNIKLKGSKSDEWTPLPFSKKKQKRVN